jgi:hypothetical protein
MNRRRLFQARFWRWLAVLSVLGVVLGLVPGTVSARASRWPFTGHEDCTPPTVAVFWITGDKVVHMRDGEKLCVSHLSDLRISGAQTWSFSGDVQFTEPYPSGPFRGTLIVEKEDGYWDGHWSGESRPDGSMTVYVQLKGYGAYQGLHAEYTSHRPESGATAEAWGEILETGAYTP